MSDQMIYKAFTAVDEKAVDVTARTVKFTITTGDVDRDNDVIDPRGWDISDYLKAPVVLWAHDHKQPPIARALDVKRTSRGLTSVAQFPDAGIYPFADMIFDLIKGGFLRAASVGFAPLEYTRDDARGGLNFERQALLEWSVVPVPANANALVAASKAGVDLGLLTSWAAGALKASGTDEPVLLVDLDDTVTFDDRDLALALRESVRDATRVIVRAQVVRALSSMPAASSGATRIDDAGRQRYVRHLAETIANQSAHGRYLS